MERDEARIRSDGAWTDYPGEHERPPFAHLPHEIDWNRLMQVRNAVNRAPLCTMAKSTTTNEVKMETSAETTPLSRSLQKLHENIEAGIRMAEATTNKNVLRSIVTNQMDASYLEFRATVQLLLLLDVINPRLQTLEIQDPVAQTQTAASCVDQIVKML
jgi:hypothetical protein